ncbi:MAG: SDR family NAD(P)-dependent oxidoreductase, partial [Clostridia bacterium]
MFKLTGKNAIVTGASRGIGKEIALKLAKQGANIAVIDMNKNEDTLKEIADLGVKVEFYSCDVSSSAETKAVVKEIAKEFGSVEILVNNAGITRDGLMLRMSDQDYDLVLGINLKGAFNMTKACYQGFMRKRYGRVINITSVSGILGNAGQANY